jgi:thiamine kinase-like enzyme
MIVHGEYYPMNVLDRAGVIVPVDWECAAIAFGELDLAALLVGWDESVTRTSMAAYAEARWGANPPADFEQNLEVGTICLGLRDWPRDGLHKGMKWLPVMRRAGETLGLL